MGETLGRYVLERRIGAGGMAEVFLARERLPGGRDRVCVVKRAYPFLSANAEFVRMFLTEAKLAAQLDHPYIAQIYDLGAVDDVYFIALEYVPGFDLLTIIQEHERVGAHVPLGVAARIASQAAQALQHAHVAVGQDGRPLGIIHRDVSPQNILLSTDGCVKLIDFGVAKANLEAQKTRAGAVKGKYHYLSPEQASGEVLDCRSDIYSLGLVLYELLTNTRALAGRSELELLDAARHARIRPVEQLRPDVPDSLRAIVGRCLAPDRRDRYASAEDLSGALEEYIAESGTPVTARDLALVHRVVAADPVITLDGPSAPDLATPPITGVDRTVVRPSAPVQPTRLTTEQAFLALRPTPAGSEFTFHGDTLSPGAVTPLQSLAGSEFTFHGSNPAQTEVDVPLNGESRRAGMKTELVHVADASRTSPAVEAAEDADTARRRTEREMPAWLGRPWLWGVLALVVAAAGAGGWWLSRDRGEPLPPSAPPKRVDPSPSVNVAPAEQPPTAPEPVAEPVREPVSSTRSDSQEPPEAASEAPTPRAAAAEVASEPLASTRAESARPAETVQRRGKLKVASTLPLSVRVDRQTHQAPFTIELAPRQYTLEISGGGLALPGRRRVTVEPGRTSTTTLETGTLAVQIDPWGELKIDGKTLVSTTSYTELVLLAGSYRVSAFNSATGRRAEKQVRVGPGSQSVQLDLRLSSASTSVAARDAAPGPPSTFGSDASSATIASRAAPLHRRVTSVQMASGVIRSWSSSGTTARPSSRFGSETWRTLSISRPTSAVSGATR